ncbi:GNAT family N-acetyltransferase [Streptomyces sp. NPDC051218]|uniref:GNAT family N-acetyltransferase n=1 Tax=Streptomyces sp. NPDC051218 TaxID=3365645 RepID=UPI0037908680
MNESWVGHASGAFVAMKRERLRPSSTPLYVKPSRTRSGIGRMLLEAVHAQAHADGVSLMLLWVLADNTRARHFYERAGYIADGAAQADDYDGVSVSDVRYRRTLE